MLYKFQKKLKQLSLGKRKFLLNKMNDYVLAAQEEQKIDSNSDVMLIFSQTDEAREQFVFAASLLVDGKRTLKETQSLVKGPIFVTSAQYEYYSKILVLYNEDLGIGGRKLFNCNVMSRSSTPKATTIRQTKIVKQRD